MSSPDGGATSANAAAGWSLPQQSAKPSSRRPCSSISGAVRQARSAARSGCGS